MLVKLGLWDMMFPWRETPNIIYVDENSIEYTKINITEDMFYEDGAYYYISDGSGGVQWKYIGIDVFFCNILWCDDVF